MKLITKIATLCLLLGGLSTSPGIFAAELPDLGEPTKAQIKASGNSIAAESLKKDAVCTKCHDESEIKPVLEIYQTKHGIKGDPRTPGCQSCHGASDAHVKNADGKATRPSPDVLFGMKSSAYSSFPRSASDKQNSTCMSCHSNASGKRNHWTGSQHESRSVVCSACHEVHAKQDKVLAKLTQPEVCFTCHKTQRSETHKISTHPIDAGKMTCSDCHNPHGSTGPKLLLKDSINATCYSCHTEKRGPLLFEHLPVTDDCSNCHTPHGSNITPLLKARPPFLCQECHSNQHANAKFSGSNMTLSGNATNIIVNGVTLQAPGNATPTTNGAGRACLNCHAMIHGSNHPSGAKLNR